MVDEPTALEVAFYQLRAAMLTGVAEKIYKEQAHALLKKDQELRLTIGLLTRTLELVRDKAKEDSPEMWHEVDKAIVCGNSVPAAGK